MKRLLILNGSFSEITLIQAAKKLGYYVITSGNNPQLIGHKYADEYIPADYSDKEAVLQLRAMEENGLVNRKVYAEVPPRVEYSLTELGKSLKPILDSMWAWGEEYKSSFTTR